MTFAPILSAAPVIQAHAAAAVLALGFGILQLWLPKGTNRHRIFGWAWAALMTSVAVSSFWISRERFAFGPFSLIHLLSILTLVSLPIGLWAAHHHRVRRHRSVMIFLFTGALVIAGAFTLLPGRILGRVLFGA